MCASIGFPFSSAFGWRRKRRPHTTYTPQRLRSARGQPCPSRLRRCRGTKGSGDHQTRRAPRGKDVVIGVVAARGQPMESRGKRRGLCARRIGGAHSSLPFSSRCFSVFCFPPLARCSKATERAEKKWRPCETNKKKKRAAKMQVKRAEDTHDHINGKHRRTEAAGPRPLPTTRATKADYGAHAG